MIVYNAMLNVRPDNRCANETTHKLRSCASAKAAWQYIEQYKAEAEDYENMDGSEGWDNCGCYCTFYVKTEEVYEYKET